MGTSRQAVSQLARAIEEAGLIERLPHPTDGRSVVVRHTDAGRRILLDALEVMSAIEVEYSRRSGEAELAELKRLLAHLLGEIDPGGAFRPGVGG
jgi:DNA-binding MarR family transcriptional regulator